MTELKMNSNGEQVIAISPYYYVSLTGGDSFVCCGEHQNYAYCFRSNTKQGCAFCEFDETQICECAVCEK